MRPIVFTRPYLSPAHLPNHAPNDACIAQLRQAGRHVHCIPTLALRPYIDTAVQYHTAQHWHQYAGIVLVSQHAAHFAHAQMQSLKLELNPRTWLGCVGQASLNSLKHLWPTHNHFIAPALHNTQDSQGLWQAIQSAHPEPPTTVLIVRAQSGRDELRSILTASGTHCHVWPCYQRTTLYWDTHHHQLWLNAIAHNAVIVATSIQGLDALIDNLKDRPDTHPFWMRQTLITLHPRITEYAYSLGCTDVQTCTPHELCAQLLAT